MKHTGLYVINTLILLFCLTANAQEKTAKVTDSIKYTQKYGLRVGADLSKLIRTAIDEDYKGFELNGDFRLTESWYLAAELGTEENTTTTDFLSATASGSYLKGGLDYNMYTNWLGMENMIYSGFRGGFSTFSQTRNSYTVYVEDQYWAPQFTNTEPKAFNGLSAVWVEFIIGIKAEVLNNLYVGLNAQLKGLISYDQPDNFDTLYIPGFNKTYDSGKFGVGYGYTISYLIPIFKKNK
ncbi:DUF6048 family protein [Lacinutrix sp. Hel_I_90]|uniref:DUF6048 family protein n=1 Tax=Lacinutrix sp. Hel_I_90 TaxID=1249999 RepID=UPI0005C878C2|nr:DUF6048 family protein [Lacinutrix sp. Hel_I_90]